MYKTNTTIFMGISALALSLTVACGGGEEAPAPAAAPAAAPAEAPKADLKPWSDALSDADMVKYGEQIFLAPGSNTSVPSGARYAGFQRTRNRPSLTGRRR